MHSNNSDHSILINVNMNTKPEDHGVPKWNFSKADWQKFSAACDETFDLFLHFTELRLLPL